MHGSFKSCSIIVAKYDARKDQRQVRRSHLVPTLALRDAVEVLAQSAERGLLRWREPSDAAREVREGGLGRGGEFGRTGSATDDRTAHVVSIARVNPVGSARTRRRGTGREERAIVAGKATERVNR